VLEAPNHRNSAVNPLGRLNSGGASSPLATATGGAWIHEPPLENPNKQGDLQRPPPLFPSLPAVRTTSPAKHQETQTAMFPILSPF